MLSLPTLVFASAALLGTAVAAPWSTTPIPPSQDPWYTGPDGYECESPGTVLRVRKAPGNATSIVAGIDSAWNVLYATTDSRYNPSWAVTTVFVPNKYNGTAFLSYQVPYDTADVDDSPSYAIYSGLADFEIWGPALSKGWLLSVPDYEGPNASFTAGVQSGHATIDSVRAVLSLNKKFGMLDNVTYAMWGYSGGALASEWASELQVQYAPELNFAGAALDGLTPNVTNVLLSISGHIGSGLAPSAILGLTSQYPDVRAYLLKILKQTGPYNATSFLAALNESLAEASVAYVNQNITEYFVGGLNDLLVPLVQKAINSDGIMGYHGFPQMPLYVYKAIGDEISPIADTDALVDKYCGIGVNILYERNTIGGHSAEGTNGALAAFSWLDNIFSPPANSTSVNATSYNPTPNCIIRNVSVNITDSPI